MSHIYKALMIKEIREYIIFVKISNQKFTNETWNICNIKDFHWILTAFGVSSSFIRLPSNRNLKEFTGTP